MVPASIRYKNPGAMWGSPLAKKWGSTDTVTLHDGKGQGNNIAVFPTYVSGICAQLDLWRTSKNYKNKPFSEAIRVWSGGNSVEQYISFVLSHDPGMHRDTVMNDDFWRSPLGIGFLKAQAWHEAGQKYPASDAEFAEAQKIVMGAQVVKPTQQTKPANQPKPEKPEGKKPWYKKASTWVKTTIGGGALGGAAWTVDWMTIVAVAAAVVVTSLVYVYLIPPRGQLKKW